MQEAFTRGEAMVQMSLRMVFNGLLDAVSMLSFLLYICAVLTRKRWQIRTPYTETIAALSETIVALSQQLKFSNAEISRLQAENEKLNSHNRSLEISNARMEEKLASGNADITRIRNERNQLRSVSSDNQQEVSRIRYQMEELAQAKHDLMMASIGSGSSGKEVETFNGISSTSSSLE